MEYIRFFVNSYTQVQELIFKTFTRIPLWILKKGVGNDSENALLIIMPENIKYSNNKNKTPKRKKHKTLYISTQFFVNAIFLDWEKIVDIAHCMKGLIFQILLQ